MHQFKLNIYTTFRRSGQRCDHIQENVPEVEEIKDAVLKEIDFMRNLKQQLVQVHQELCLQNYKLTYHILND